MNRIEKLDLLANTPVDPRKEVGFMWSRNRHPFVIVCAVMLFGGLLSPGIPMRFP
jgi:hypothetical protein